MEASKYFWGPVDLKILDTFPPFRHFFNNREIQVISTFLHIPATCTLFNCWFNADYVILESFFFFVLNRISWWMSAKKCSCKPCGLNDSLTARLQQERKLYRYLKNSLIYYFWTCREKERALHKLSPQNLHNGNHVPW